ncbi:MAG: T9SS type A sorting domain-containing protein, partial [Bacteroidota bacterium]|nr:T9SS type A sorting domain-containing protein [Bacteroidota bacterium]
VSPGGLYDSVYFLFSGGFAFSGKENGTLFVNGQMPSMREIDYLPGRTGDTLNPKNILYSVSTSDSAFGSSWLKWKDAVELGAAYYDGNNDGIYNPVDLNGNGIWDPNEDKPLIMGDKTFWCVYNDGVKSSQRIYSDMAPKGVEIRQTTFAYNNANNCADNAFFIKYNIKNTSDNNWDSCYFSNFSDVDLGDSPKAELVGTNIGLKSVYAYREESVAPTCFVTSLQSPVQYIPGVTFTDINGNGIYDAGIDTPLDTAYNYNGINGVQSIVGAVNINDFNTLLFMGADPDLGDPSTSTELRYFQLSKLNRGQNINPCDFQRGTVNGGADCNTIDPRYIFSGDPVSNYGWLQVHNYDSRQLLNIGPFSLKAHESNNLIFAYVLGSGNTWQMSLLTAQDNTRLIRKVFNNNFTNFYTGVSSNNITVKNYKLEQNFPNPFNPVTTINYQLPKSGEVTIRVYDILGNEVKTLVNENKQAGSYSVNFNASKLSSGVYIYRLTSSGICISQKMLLLK